MKTKQRVFFFLGLMWSTICFANAPRPNIIFILCDDLGIGDIGAYGQEKLKTPHIDSIAQNGLKFTAHYSGSTVCAPSRCALMTGKHMGHAVVRGNYGRRKHIPGEIGEYPLPEDAFTLAKVLKSAGYTTGMFGKWGLGGPHNSGATQKQGFDEFLGYYSQSLAHSYYPECLWHNSDPVPLNRKVYSHDLIWSRGIDFLREQAKTSKPFFLYFPVTVPHAAMSAPRELHEKWRKIYPQFDKRIGRYADKDAPDCCVTNPIAGFAAMMENLDNQIGLLIQELKQLGIYENTLLIFTSDNGAHKEGGHDPRFWNSNGDYRGLKRDLYEGGVRTPMLISWPRYISPGTTTDKLSAFWDWLPTFAELAGVKLPDSIKIDGISLAPILTGNKKEKQDSHRYLFWEFTEGTPKMAVRFRHWKAIWFYEKDGRTLKQAELYNLDKDPGEKNNLTAIYPEILKELAKFRDTAHSESAAFPFQKP